MKYACNILAAYLLLLAMMPCADSIVHESMQVGIAMEETQCDHDHEDDHSDCACTPLCSCMCCGSVFTVASTNGEQSTLKLAIGEENFQYAPALQREYAQRIWHPPTTA